MDKRIENEKKRIYELLDTAGVKDSRRDCLEGIIDNCAFMRVKLEDCQGEIKASNVVVPYDNGGGQKGLRENPLFKGYEALLKHYLMAMDKVMAVLPKDAENAYTGFISDAENTIELVKSLKVKTK